MKKTILPVDTFFQKLDRIGLSITYDDVRLRTRHSAISPVEADVSSHFSRNTPLQIPIISSAMDTVTETRMAIAMATLGGLGVIHRSLAPEIQIKKVRKVKFHLNGLIEKPITARNDETIGEITQRREEKGYEFHSFPVIDAAGNLVGLLTRRDFNHGSKPKTKAESVMTPRETLVVAKKGTTLKEAKALFQKHRNISVLPLTDDAGVLAGMFVLSDVLRLTSDEPVTHNVDANGHLRVGAAIGAGEEEVVHAGCLVEAGCDVLVLQSAHGDTNSMFETVRALKKKYPNTDLVVGNISEPSSARRLASLGVDGILVGQGPGSICTTRIVAGVGCPQASAVYECAKEVRGSGIPVCADGGIKNSGDITVALGIGASSVMLGRILAGTDESPGKQKKNEKGELVKLYRGMGSTGAMEAHKAARARYRQHTNKVVPEGVPTEIPYQGPVSEIIRVQVGGLRLGMGYLGAATIDELHQVADLRRISTAALRESYPHDVTVISEARASGMHETV